MPATAMQIIAGALTFLFTIGFALSASLLGGRTGQVVPRLLAAFAAICFATLAASSVAIEDAERHGAFDLSEMTVPELFAHSALAPVDQSESLPEEPSSCIVYFFMYTCPDCEAVHADLSGWLESQSAASGLPVYNVSSHSKRGIALKEMVGLREVPSVAVFRPDGTFEMRIVYRTQDNESVIDADALTALGKEIEHAAQG